MHIGLNNYGLLNVILVIIEALCYALGFTGYTQFQNLTSIQFPLYPVQLSDDWYITEESLEVENPPLSITEAMYLVAYQVQKMHSSQNLKRKKKKKVPI